MHPKTAEEIQGYEYDWLACDDDQRVALFSTAGGGYAPPNFLLDPEAHELAIDLLFAMPARCAVESAPEVAPGLPNAWKLAAERGLFAFDSDPHGGPYRLVAVPKEPVLVTDLPDNIAAVACRIALRGVRFSNITDLPAELLENE